MYKMLLFFSEGRFHEKINVFLALFDRGRLDGADGGLLKRLDEADGVAW